MPSEDSSSASSNGASPEFLELLENLRKQGFSQVDIAHEVCVSPQYISDMKSGRRDLTQSFARKLERRFGVDAQWLLGRPLLGTSSLGAPPFSDTSRTERVPGFDHPIAGDPYTHPQWNHWMVELTDAVASQIGKSKWPYVVLFGRNDRQGRLCKSDLVLISQSNHPDAAIQVVKVNQKCILARRKRDGDWERVAKPPREDAPDEPIPGSYPSVGYCVGVIWGKL